MVKIKHNIIVVIICFSCYIILTGCQKSPINGDLDGRWQILEIEHNNEIELIKDQQLYYNFYLHVCNLSYYGMIYTDGNLEYKDDIITLDFPYITAENEMKNLNRYGIYSNPVKFEVFYLDKKKLVMGNDESVITLRKF